VFVVVFVFVLCVSLFSVFFVLDNSLKNGFSGITYLGVSFCGDNVAEAKLLVDRVKDYTNVFVLQSGPISHNETATGEICDYAVSQGLSLIVYFGWFAPDQPWRYPWIQNATQKYEDKFLGVYYYDEPGGSQIDYDWTSYFNGVYNNLESGGDNSLYQNISDSIKGYLNGTIRDYDAEANIFTNHLQNHVDLNLLRKDNITTFVSDYALYWWDYLGGYDVVFTQLGWNNSAIQEIDLIKGAAHLQSKEWGAIATWKYSNEPYLGNGEEIYNQLLLAYKAGAKYLIIFDYPTIDGNPYGVLTDEHFEALQTLWVDINNPAAKRLTKPEAVLVLPKNYGGSLRHAKDRVWLWGPDENSQQIWGIT
jgi:hypothetical protein